MKMKNLMSSILIIIFIACHAPSVLSRHDSKACPTSIDGIENFMPDEFAGRWFGYAQNSTFHIGDCSILDFNRISENPSIFSLTAHVRIVSGDVSRLINMTYDVTTDENRGNLFFNNAETPSLRIVKADPERYMVTYSCRISSAFGKTESVGVYTRVPQPDSQLINEVAENTLDMFGINIGNLPVTNQDETCPRPFEPTIGN